MSPWQDVSKPSLEEEQAFKLELKRQADLQVRKPPLSNEELSMFKFEEGGDSADLEEIEGIVSDVRIVDNRSKGEGKGHVAKTASFLTSALEIRRNEAIVALLQSGRNSTLEACVGSYSTFTGEFNP